MLRAITLQVALVLVAAVLGMLPWGLDGFRDILLGGAACFIPNALFAWRLRATEGRPARSFVLAFFLGEAIKIVLTLFMLMAIVKWLAPAHWEALLLGMVVALQAPWLLAFFQRYSWFDMTGDNSKTARPTHNQIS